MNKSLPVEAVAIDVETTGISPLRGHRVIEIAAVRIETAGIGEAFHRLIDCGRPIPAAARRIHGINDDMLKGQSNPAVVFARFRVFIGDRPLVAHNAGFDRAFLRHEYSLLGWTFANRMHCTLTISRNTLPRLPDEPAVECVNDRNGICSPHTRG